MLHPGFLENSGPAIPGASVKKSVQKIISNKKRHWMFVLKMMNFYFLYMAMCFKGFLNICVIYVHEVSIYIDNRTHKLFWLHQYLCLLLFLVKIFHRNIPFRLLKGLGHYYCPMHCWFVCCSWFLFLFWLKLRADVNFSASRFPFTSNFYPDVTTRNMVCNLV